MYDEGISREGSIIDAALNYNVIRKEGAWFSYGEQKIGQGKENTRSFLKQNPKLLSEIEKKVMETVATSEG